jgi:hypothetical protein
MKEPRIAVSSELNACDSEHCHLFRESRAAVRAVDYSCVGKLQVSESVRHLTCARTMVKTLLKRHIHIDAVIIVIILQSTPS